MRALCQKQLEFLIGLDDYRLKEGEQPAAQQSASPQSSEPSVSSMGGVADEIKKIVSETDKAPSSETNEPTRLFTTTDASAPQQSAQPNGQFGFDNIRFGK